MNLNNVKFCWICFRDDGDGWVNPCKCRGSLRWVHQQCLIAWIKSKNSQHPQCGICKTFYRIVKKDAGLVAKLMDVAESVTALTLDVFKSIVILCPITVLLYSMCQMYGASFLCLFIEEPLWEAENLGAKFVRWVVLPAIPGTLMLARHFLWTRFVGSRHQVAQSSLLLFPFMAHYTGQMLMRRTKSWIQCLAGGAVILAARAFWNGYLRRKHDEIEVLNQEDPRPLQIPRNTNIPQIRIRFGMKIE